MICLFYVKLRRLLHLCSVANTPAEGNGEWVAFLNFKMLWLLILQPCIYRISCAQLLLNGWHQDSQIANFHNSFDDVSYLNKKLVGTTCSWVTGPPNGKHCIHDVHFWTVLNFYGQQLWWKLAWWWWFKYGNKAIVMYIGSQIKNKSKSYCINRNYWFQTYSPDNTGVFAGVSPRINSCSQMILRSYWTKHPL